MRVILGVLAVLSAGCTTSSFIVQRSSLSPQLTAASQPGAEFTGEASLDARYSHLTGLDAAANGGERTATYVPRSQGGLGFAYSPSDKVTLGAQGEVGLAQKSFPSSSSLRSVNPATDLVGARSFMRVRLQAGNRWELGLQPEAGLYVVPVRLEESCPLGCNGRTADLTEFEWTVGMTVFPTLKGEGWAVYGILSGRNQPASERLGVVHSSGSGINQAEASNGDHVGFGPFNGGVGVGVRARLGKHVALYGQAFQPLARAPVRYRPLLDFGLSFVFETGRRPPVTNSSESTADDLAPL